MIFKYYFKNSKKNITTLNLVLIFVFFVLFAIRFIMPNSSAELTGLIDHNKYKQFETIIIDKPNLMYLTRKDFPFPKDSILFYCIKNNKTRFVKILLKNNIQLNRKKKGKSNFTPPLCYLALESNNVDIAKLLIKAGANIEAKGFRHFSTPLHVAVANNKLKLAELFINKGANVNARDSNKNTPLMSAVLNQHYKMTKLLLKNGANPNSMSYNKTPLKIAVQDLEDLAMVKLLLEYGADPELAGVIEKNPVYLWNDKKRKEIQDYLKEYIKKKKDNK